jgi:hypothetical protein
MPRNDRDSSGHSGRGRNQYGIGPFEQSQFERSRGPEVERSRPESLGRERHDYPRDRDDRSRYEARREDTRDYRRDDDDYDRQDRSWFDRARDNVRGWFHRDEDEYADRGPYRGEGYMSERDARRRYHMNEDERHGDHQVFGGRGLQAHDDPYEVRRDEQRRFGVRGDYYDNRSVGRDDLDLGPRYRAETVPDDERYRYERRFAHDDRQRYVDTNDDPRHSWAAWSGRADREHEDYSRRLARYERYPQTDDGRYGHPSVRGNRIDYAQQWVSRTGDEDHDRASGTRGRDDDQDRSFVPRDEYGRRRR